MFGGWRASSTGPIDAGTIGNTIDCSEVLAAEGPTI